MLAVVREKLTNLLLNSDTLEYTKGEIKKVIEDISKFEKTNETMTDMHAAFRALEDYNIQYATETINYYALDEVNISKRVIQVQKILCIVIMSSAVISTVLRRYNTGKEANGTGTIAKYLRMLNEQKESLKNDKITWTGILKSLTTMVADITADKAIQEKEILLKIKEAQVDKG